MPSPFPGMDPYLENPALWGGVHDGLINAIRAQLNAMLPDMYVADVEERLYIVQSERDVRPDVVLVQSRTVSSSPSAIAAVADPPLHIESLTASDEIREAFIKIVAPGLDYRVVTIIEVLSHTNKTPGHPGRQLYLQKQAEILATQVHLLEIDLLHAGEHTVAVPKHQIPRAYDYLVCLHRAGSGAQYEVWTVTLNERLPRVWVPLLEGDADVVLDLQQAFHRCYEDGAYHRLVDYRQIPPISLPAETLAWAIQQARGA